MEPGDWMHEIVGVLSLVRQGLGVNVGVEWSWWRGSKREAARRREIIEQIGQSHRSCAYC